MNSAVPAEIVTARIAEVADLESLLTLARRAKDESVGERGGHLLFDLTHADVAQTERYEQILQDTGRVAFLGLVDQAVVGYATATIESGSSETVCVLNELFVHEQARAVGVGAAMLEQAQLWARSNKCSYIESQVLPGNRAAKNFFERVGMVTRAMRVSAPLDAADD